LSIAGAVSRKGYKVFVMPKRIVLIQGHPDPSVTRFCRALADSYIAGASANGHEVRQIAVGEIDFPLLRTREDYEKGVPSASILAAQETLAWAEHWVIVYPLWLGDLPALLKGFFEQVGRPGFAFRYRAKGFPEKLMAGRSARVVVTMGMPSFWYRFFYFSHSLRSFERNLLKFVGINPVRATIIGGVGTLTSEKAKAWLSALEKLGRDGV
jgi:putative NADPH-quinone reductase